MNFIAVVISLLVERLLGDHQNLRGTGWYRSYSGWAHEALGGYGFWSGPVGVLLLVGVPAALTGLVYSLLGGALLSILALVFSVIILLLMLGPRELDGEVSEYIGAIESGDDDRATGLARAIIGHEQPAKGAARNRAVAEASLVEFNRRTFAVLFWFVVLGPLGAVLYRVTTLARADALAGARGDAGFTEAINRLQGILDWVPVRLIALGFALAGSFEDAITDWKGYYDHGAEAFWDRNEGVLTASGRGALRLGDVDDADDGASSGLGGVRAALALMLRTLIFWVAFYGLLTIAGLAI